MPENYLEIIRECDSEDLKALLERIEHGQPIDRWPSGKAFEHLILRAIEIEGARVRWPYTVSYLTEVVEQIDGVIYSEHLSCLIEAKDYAQPINIEPIAKLRNHFQDGLRLRWDSFLVEPALRNRPKS
jgi:hypothetical protein